MFKQCVMVNTVTVLDWQIVAIGYLLCDSLKLLDSVANAYKLQIIHYNYIHINLCTYVSLNKNFCPVRRSCKTRVTRHKVVGLQRKSLATRLFRRDAACLESVIALQNIYNTDYGPLCLVQAPA